ncbi:DUF2147 domain-containing protein [Acetobacteraceae bacterium]|nr:DUF2147 domain-containing protein [Acetobacteraceae bacterium]
MIFIFLLAFPTVAICDVSFPEEGLWRPQKDRDAIFRIAPCEGGAPQAKALCGWLVGLDYNTSDGPPKDFSGRSECGLEILRNFIMDKNLNAPLQGMVLDPRSGAYYHASLWMDRLDTLKLRGYLGIPLLGRTVTWSRYKGPPIGPHCQMAKGI